MDILKFSIEWAKAEVYSARFFILFAVLFLAASIGFWQLGKTEVARAYIVPAAIAGTFLLAVGVGIYYANYTRITTFEQDYNADASAFVEAEVVRTEKSMGEYSLIVFKIIPLIIVAAALLILFLDGPKWRAASITTIALMVAIMIVDSNANARLQEYRAQLEQVRK